MNNTKWAEKFEAFHYGFECGGDPVLRDMEILWTNKSTSGYVYSDSAWPHFGCGLEKSKEIDWLKIHLSP